MEMCYSKACIELDAACPVLAKSRSVQAVVAHAVGAKDFAAAHKLMEAGKLDGDMGGTLHDLLADTIRNDATEVWAGFIHVSDDDDDDYPVAVNEYQGVFWIYAGDQGPYGYFLDKDSAVEFVYFEWDNVYEDGDEPSDEEASSDSSAREDSLTALLVLSLQERLDAVAEDIRRGELKFNNIDAHHLADALEVPDHDNPGGNWSFITYARIVSAEEYAASHCTTASDVVFMIKDAVSAHRFRQIVEQAKALADIDDKSFVFLNENEHGELERQIADEQRELNAQNGMCIIARYVVKSKAGAILEFEGDIEDDGACLTLRTPYDKSANEFKDLSDCVARDW